MDSNDGRASLEKKYLVSMYGQILVAHFVYLRGSVSTDLDRGLTFFFWFYPL